MFESCRAHLRMLSKCRALRSAWTLVAADQAFEDARRARAAPRIFERGLRIDTKLLGALVTGGGERSGEVDHLLQHRCVADTSCGCRGSPREVARAGVCAVLQGRSRVG